MALLFTILSGIFGAVVNATAFTGASLRFSMLRDDGGKKRERHDLALKKLQEAKDKWNEDQIKQLDVINKRLREKTEARAYINNADEAMFEYYRASAKQIKPLPPEPQLSDFYHPSEAQKMVNYYLLQWVQALQHMPHTSTLNK